MADTANLPSRQLLLVVPETGIELSRDAEQSLIRTLLGVETDDATALKILRLILRGAPWVLPVGPRPYFPHSKREAVDRAMPLLRELLQRVIRTMPQAAPLPAMR